MSNTSSVEIAELQAQVAALSAVVAALFASTTNINSIGEPTRLAFYAEAIARAGQVDPERVTAMANRVAQQASVAAKVFRELHS